jgi:hypothetical protein
MYQRRLLLPSPAQVENRSAIKPKQAEIEVELLKNGPAQLVARKPEPPPSA